MTKPVLLVFGSKNFNNSIEEIKENLGYSFLFFDFNKPYAFLSSLIVGVIVDSQISADKANLEIINKFNRIPILLINELNTKVKTSFDETISLPISFLELKKKIINIIAISEFNLNSFVKIKNYILNKNEKKLTKLNTSVFITEREVQLIELLFKEKKPLSKNFILKKIWNYSENTDTNTVETHIYRLRKKINEKFNDNDFILNSGTGYSIWKKEIK